MKLNEIIVVSGLPRSGTSMMMQLLCAGGVPILIDNIRPADVDNPRGYYEYEPVKFLNNQEGVDWFEHAQGKVIKIISYFLHYLPTEYVFKIIFMKRNLEEVLLSQDKMLLNKNILPQLDNSVQLKHIFNSHLEDIDKWINKQNNIAVHFVKYESILNFPEIEVIAIEKFLNVEFDIQKAVQSIDPSLYRNKVIGD